MGYRKVEKLLSLDVRQKNYGSQNEVFNECSIEMKNFPNSLQLKFFDPKNLYDPQK